MSLLRVVSKIRISVRNAHFTKTNFNNGVKTITMCDVKTRNSLSIGMMKDLLQNIQEHQDDKNLRVVVLAAEGPIFSAGHNLKELTSESGKEQHKQVFELSTELMLAIVNHPVPILAKINGLAAAAGCQLIAQCDIAICSEKSTFSTPGANFGIFCSTPGIPLARKANKSTALYMLFTGQPISSQKAVESGLIFKSCSEGDLDEEIDNVCKAISSKSRAVIELGKRFFYKQIGEDLKKAYQLGAVQMCENLQLKDGQEGVESFVEKRKPTWVHRF